jgi:hypothetical protein
VEEIVLLRSHFGISALEARHSLPAWERELLLEVAKQANQDEDERPPTGNTFDRVPEGLDA